MTTRIMINAPAGVIEIEGEKEFVEAQLDKLLPLIEACRFGVGAEVSEQADADGEHTAAQAAVDAVPAAVGNGKRSKRAINRPPKGHSCAARMMVLRSDGFFKEQRTPAQIVEGLGKKGWTHTGNQVSAAAGQMFKRGNIQRTKSGNGFAYYWDRG